MRHTIYLPDDLDQAVNAYLQDRPDVSLSTLVQDTLRERIAPRDTTAIMELMGIVSEASTQAGDRAEDQFTQRER